MTKIALLSHRFGNIGHWFMALGMEEIVREVYGRETQIIHFEQHRPFEVYPGGHWLRKLNNVPHHRLKIVRRVLGTSFMTENLYRGLSPLDFDLAIACGGPSLVPGVSASHQMYLLLHHLNGAFRYRGVPFLDLAVGSAFPHEAAAKRITDPEDRKFFKKALSLVDRVTVRDSVADAVVRDLGYDSRLIPCAALVSGRAFERIAPQKPKDESYVAVNFQPAGANEDWGQGVDREKWARTVGAAITDLQSRHLVKMLAHSEEEYRVASLLYPNVECVYPTSIFQYRHFLLGAKAGLASRVHAALAAAGVGIPSVLIGTDSRMGTLDQIGLPTKYVKEAEAAWIVQAIEGLLSNRLLEFERLVSLREDVAGQYGEVLTSLGLGTGAHV